GTDATTLGSHADHRLLVHLGLGDQPAGRGIQSGEVDSGCLSNHTASSVAADEILPAQRRAPGHLDIDAGVVLREVDDLAPARDGNPQFADPVSQDGLELALPQCEYVVVAGREVADVQADPPVPQDVDEESGGKERFGDATLIEHLDGARVEAPCSRSVDI